MNTMFRIILLCVSLCTVGGCSSASFTRAEKPFDGTVHATSSLICAGYWSNHDYKRNEKSRTYVERVVPTVGLIVYSSLDLASSALLDLVLLPAQAIGGGPRVVPFDQVPHSILPCGTLQNSINVVGGL